MSEHDIDPKKWLDGVVEVDGEELERIRYIPQRYDSEWKPFPDAGLYQMTRLTAEKTGGACNAYYIKMRRGEGFPIHKHPNAVHIMIGVEGEGSIYWREPTGEKYRTSIRPGAGVFAIPADAEHAIFADRESDLVFLVINAPAEDIHRHNYQMHVEAHHKL